MSTHLKIKPCIQALLLLGTTAYHSVTMAVPTTEDWRVFNQQMLEHHVLPRYKSLSISSEELKEATIGLCKTTDDAHLQKARSAFHHTMDAWESIQHIRSGPIETMMRNYSMQFWPDKKNHVGKHLETLITEKNITQLTSDDFYSITVAVRGLPAIERLLFDDGSLEALDSNRFRCKVLERISAYVNEMSSAVTDEWQQEMIQEFATAGAEEDSLYESQEEAAVVILKPIIETLEIIKDLKIKRTLGSQFSMVKSKRLESWRSQRSLVNIKLNIAAVKAIYTGENGSSASLRQLLSDDEKSQLDTLFSTVEKSLNNIEQPMEIAVNSEQGYQTFLALTDDIERLLKAVESTIGNNGIFLGFNSRDGD